MTNTIGRREVISYGVATLGAAAGLGGLRTAPAAARDQSSAPAGAVLYYNGTILTMEGDTPATVEAVVTRDGKIAFAGPRDAALAMAGDARQVDLQGLTMLPGFMDSWGHYMLFAQETLGVNLAYFSDNPPRNKADILAGLKAAAPFNGWIFGFGYVESFLADGPPTLADLDAAFPDTPVLIATLSTLTGMVNSAGLRKLGWTPETAAPQPGEIVKDPSTGKLTGGLLFTPLLVARATAIGTYSQEVAFQTFRAAEQLLAGKGYTTVQSYQLAPEEIANLRAAFDQGVIALDVIGIPNVADDNAFKWLQKPDWTWGAYSHGDHGLKIPGYQVATDAVPQLQLAAFTEPYFNPGSHPVGWKGQLFDRDSIDQWAAYAYRNDIQYFGYSNGDAGIDLQLAAIETAIAASGKTGDRRTIISHSYFVRDDQLPKYKAMDIGVAVFPMHMTIYGDVLLDVLGPERASRENPFASAKAAGVRTTLHSDCPSSSPSVMDTVWSAVSRATFGSRVLGPEEAASPYDALLAMTRNVAYVFREEASKGTITAGKTADLVILDGNPLTVATGEIRNIKVVETIKRGTTLYRRT